jgi:hypothetical protein
MDGKMRAYAAKQSILDCTALLDKSEIFKVFSLVMITTMTTGEITME